MFRDIEKESPVFGDIGDPFELNPLRLQIRRKGQSSWIGSIHSFSIRRYLSIDGIQNPLGVCERGFVIRQIIDVAKFSLVMTLTVEATSLNGVFKRVPAKDEMAR